MMSMKRITGCAGLLVVVLATAGFTAEHGSQERPGPSWMARTLRALGLASPPGARGDRAYRAGDHAGALRHYGRAAEEAGASSPAIDRAIGNALYRQGRDAEAADFYGRALRGLPAPGTARDSQAVARLHHNRGNALARAATARDANPQTALEGLREAAAHYKQAIRHAPSLREPRRNLGRVLAQLRALEQQQQQAPRQGNPQQQPEPSEHARAALARALQLSQERRYDEAMQVLGNVLREDRTAAPYAEHLKRLEAVTRILRGEAPVPSRQVPGGPR